MAGWYSIRIKQGTAFTQEFTWTDDNGTAINTTGKTGKFVAKVRYSDTTPVINATSATSSIELGGTNGKIIVKFTAAETRAMSFQFVRYDLFMDDELVLSGDITLERTTIDA